MDKADLILTNAAVWTANPAQPWAEAVAIRGNRIQAAGDAAFVEALRGPSTRVIDCRGRTLMPGFIDSHYHLLWGSLELADAPLGEIGSLVDLQAALRAYAAEHPGEPWIVGQGLRYLPGGITRQNLDAVIPDRPVAITAYDGHTTWANTAALALAGILHGAPTPAGSEIVMSPDGTATGELREPGATRYITVQIPEPDDASTRALLHRGLAQAAALGITSVHNMDGTFGQLARYMALEDAGELSLRVYVPLHVKPEMDLPDLEEAVEMQRANPGGMARGGAVKFFMDGVIESYTALLLEDYAGAPGNKGDALFTAEQFNRMAAAADQRSLQIAVHAIGDGAVRRTLDGYAQARGANGPRDSRHRVEHIELIHPADLPRFRQLGVIASMQPEHAPMEPQGTDIWPARVGPERWDRSFAWRWLRDAGAHVVFGSDWPVVAQSPFRGIHAALNRPPWSPGGAVHRQTLEETLRSYTADAAFAEFMEQEKGRIRPGFFADLVLLSKNLFRTPAEEMEQVKPVLTMCDGKIVYSADEVSGS